MPVYTLWIYAVHAYDKSLEGSFGNKEHIKNDNRRPDFILSLHMQQSSLRGCTRASPTPTPLPAAEAVFAFQSNQNGPNDPKGNKI